MLELPRSEQARGSTNSAHQTYTLKVIERKSVSGVLAPTSSNPTPDIHATSVGISLCDLHVLCCCLEKAVLSRKWPTCVHVAEKWQVS